MVINFDTNASYGLLALVGEQIAAAVKELPLNPSSVHQRGQKARAIVEEARASVGALCGVDKDAQIIFTSGATEANNTALRSAVYGPNAGGVVTSALEHHSVLEPALELARMNIPVQLYHPTAQQEYQFSRSLFLSHVQWDTSLVSLMLANNETGEIFPVREIAQSVRAIAPKSLVHTDAVQALGKMPLCFSELGVDMMSVSGHKIGALSGIGALIAKRGVLDNSPLLRGGPQEHRLRAGTENVIGIYSFGLAAEIVRATLTQRIARMKEAREFLVRELTQKLPTVQVLSQSGESLPNTINLRVPGVRADDLVVALDLAGVSISSGAACASGKQEPSHVLRAMGFSGTAARESVRISVSAEHTNDELVRGAATLVQVITHMQKRGGSTDEHRV